MVASLVCFTANALLLKHLGTSLHVSPWLALLFRALVGAVVVWIMFAPAGRLNFRRALCSRMLVSRGVMGALGTAAYYVTLPVLGAGKATLIGNTWVIWSALLAACFLHEHLSLRKVGGIGLALGGIALLTGLESGNLHHIGPWEVISITGALIAAATVVVIRQLTRTESSGTIFASQCIYSALLALPFVIGLPWPGTGAIGLLTLAAVAAALGQIAMTEGFRHLPVSSGGAFHVLVPLCITAGSILLFDEPFTSVQAGGAALILAGCHLSVSARKSTTK